MRFRKKPVMIEAVQWHKHGDHPQVRPLADSDDLFFTGMGGATLTLELDREAYGVIGTLESPNHLVTPGDWIITGVAGEHYACKPDIFERTYEPAETPAAGAPGLQPHQQRVVAEKAELDERLAKLTEFVCNSETYSTLDADEKYRLNRQQHLMADYSQILAARIRAFGAQPQG